MYRTVTTDWKTKDEFRLIMKHYISPLQQDYKNQSEFLGNQNLWLFLSVVSTLYVTLLNDKIGVTDDDDYICLFGGILLWGGVFYIFTRNNSSNKPITTKITVLKYIFGVLFGLLFITQFLSNISDLKIPITLNWIRSWLFSYVLISLSIYCLFFKPSNSTTTQKVLKCGSYIIILLDLLTLTEHNEFIYSSYSGFGYFKTNWTILIIQLCGFLISAITLNIINKKVQN